MILLLEAIFFISVLYLHYHFFIPSADAALRAGEVMQEEIQQKTDAELYTLDQTLSENDAFMTEYLRLLENIAYFFLGILGITLLARGPIWYLSHSLVHPVSLKRTWLKFIGLTLVWFVFLIAALLVYSVLEGSTTTILPVVSSRTASALFIIATAIIAYLAQTSYALLSHDQTFKNTFLFAFKQAKKAGPAWLVSALITFVALTLPLNWIIRPPIALAVYAAISIPLLHFARINLIVPWSKK